MLHTHTHSLISQAKLKLIESLDTQQQSDPTIQWLSLSLSRR